MKGPIVLLISSSHGPLLSLPRNAQPHCCYQFSTLQEERPVRCICCGTDLKHDMEVVLFCMLDLSVSTVGVSHTLTVFVFCSMPLLLTSNVYFLLGSLPSFHQSHGMDCVVVSCTPEIGFTSGLFPITGEYKLLVITCCTTQEVHLELNVWLEMEGVLSTRTDPVTSTS